MSNRNSSYDAGRHRGSYDSDLLAAARRGAKHPRRGSNRSQGGDLEFFADVFLDREEVCKICFTIKDFLKFTY